MKLSETIGEYASFQEARGDSDAHRRECARILSDLCGRLADPVIEEVSSEVLRNYLSVVRSRPGLKGRLQVSNSTVFAYHRTLAAFFHFLEAQEVIAKNPMKRVPKPRLTDYLVRPFTQDQLRKLLEEPDLSTFTGIRDAALMCFLLDTGCRISEALSLPLTDLDIERREARIMGKGRRERSIPFGGRTRLWLERYFERRQTSAASNLVFVNQYGEKFDARAFTHRMETYGVRAGLNGVRVSPHTLRHTFAVTWLMGNGDYKGDAISLQRILGHSSPAMTQRYVHFSGQNLHQLHDRLSPADQVMVAPPAEERRRRIR